MSKFLHKILAMAFTRDEWIRKARNRLEGALGEFAKQKFGEALNFSYSWEEEIKSLLQAVDKLCDPQKTKTKAKFELKKAFKEAVSEVVGDQHKIVYARNMFESLYLIDKKPKEKSRLLHILHKTHFSTEDLIEEMFNRYQPTLLKYLK